MNCLKKNVWLSLVPVRSNVSCPNHSKSLKLSLVPPVSTSHWLTQSLVSTRSSTVSFYYNHCDILIKHSIRWIGQHPRKRILHGRRHRWSTPKGWSPSCISRLALRTLNEPPCSYNLLYSSAVQKCENSESKIIRGKFPFSKNQLFISTKDNRINLFICSWFVQFWITPKNKRDTSSNKIQKTVKLVFSFTSRRFYSVLLWSGVVSVRGSLVDRLRNKMVIILDG